jgi:hypothetical protein
MEKEESGHVERSYVPDLHGKKKNRSRREVLRDRFAWEKEEPVT